MAIWGGSVYKNGNTTIKDQRFAPAAGQSPRLALELKDQIPQVVKGKNNTLALGGQEFDITMMVCNTANIGQIFNGWNNLVAAKIPMDLLFLSLFLRDITTDYNNTKILGYERFNKEPELTTLPRLCYWFQRCVQINDRMQDNYFNFNDKLKEIKEELGQKTKAKARKYGLPILADYGSNIANYHVQLQIALADIIRNGSKYSTKSFGGILNDIRYSIYRFLSECIFYTLVSEAGLQIEYAKLYSNRSPKLEVHSMPSALRILLDEQIQKYHRIERIIETDNLNDEILCILQRNRRLVDKINQAFQEGVIVILDTTGTSLGYTISLYAQTQHNRGKHFDLSLKRSICKAVDMIWNGRPDHTPVVFLAQSYGNYEDAFRISAVTVQVPYDIVGEDSFKVDLSKLPRLV